MEKESSRKDILQIEKRLVDLELVVTELKESIENIKSIDVSMVPDLNQKVEDVEDLVMVEQAGIIELKKMLEEEKGAQTPAPMTLELEEKLKTFEEKITSLQTPATPSVPIDVTGLQEQIQKTINEITNIKEEMDMLKGGTTTGKSGVDVQFLSSKIEERINKLEGRMTSLQKAAPGDVRDLQEQIQTIVKEIIDLRSEMIEEISKLSKEMASGGKSGIDVQFLSSKLDSLKTVTDNLIGKKKETDLKIQTMEKALDEIRTKEKMPASFTGEMKIARNEWLTVNDRVDSLEKRIIEIIPKMETELNKFENLKRTVLSGNELSENKELSSKVEMIYKDVNEKFNKVKYLEEKVSELREEISKNKGAVPDRLSKEDVENLVKRINSLADEYKHFAGDVSKKIISVENIKPLLEKRIDELTKTLHPLVKKEIEPMEKKIKETRLDHVNEILTDVTTKIAVIESKLNSIEKNYGKKVVEVSPRIQEKVIIREPRFLEEQFKELVNRMVFLESRLIAVERMMHKTSRVLPIVIE